MGLEIIHKELPGQLQKMLREAPQDCTVYYHSPCQDGFASAWQVWEFGQRHGVAEKITYLPMNYGSTEEYHTEDVKDRVVIFVDFCPSQPKFKELAERVRWIFIIDHHIGAIEKMHDSEVPLSNVFLWMESDRKSGAGLTNEVLGNPESKIVNHVSDRDLWHFKLPETRAFCDFMMIEKEDFDHWHKLNHDSEYEYQKQIDAGCSCIARKFYDIQIILENSLCALDEWLMFGSMTVYAVNIPAFFVSDAADFVREYVGPHATFCGYQVNIATNKVYLSLRGPGARKIAESYGGGGHDAAAGCQISLETFKSLKATQLIISKDKMFAVREKLYNKVAGESHSH